MGKDYPAVGEVRGSLLGIDNGQKEVPSRRCSLSGRSPSLSSTASQWMPIVCSATSNPLRKQVENWQRSKLELDIGRRTSRCYCAGIHLSDPATLTATFENERCKGLSSAVPRCSVEKSSGPAFL